MVYKFMNKHLVTLILLSVTCINALAESDEHHDHGAHVHGIANIYLVVDEGNVFLELESPAMNLLGFEHEPRNEEQEKIVTSVNEDLMDYKMVVQFNGANCEQTEIEMEMPFVEQEHDEHHHDHA